MDELSTQNEGLLLRLRGSMDREISFRTLLEEKYGHKFSDKDDIGRERGKTIGAPRAPAESRRSLSDQSSTMSRKASFRAKAEMPINHFPQLKR